MALIVKLGPWSDGGTPNLGAALTRQEIFDQFGDTPELVDAYVALSKPFASIGEGEQVALYQISAGSTDDEGKGTLLGSSSMAYGSTLYFPNVRIDPNQGALAVFTQYAWDVATIRLAKPGQAPVQPSGINTESATDKVLDATSKAVAETFKKEAGGVAKTAVWGFVAIVLLIVFLLWVESGGPLRLARKGKA